ncbi:putative 3-oxoacyl-(acyl-carrier protein) reductase [Streptomyces misionensis JCM 4497]
MGALPRFRRHLPLRLGGNHAHSRHAITAPTLGPGRTGGLLGRRAAAVRLRRGAAQQRRGLRLPGRLHRQPVVRRLHRRDQGHQPRPGDHRLAADLDLRRRPEGDLGLERHRLPERQGRHRHGRRVERQPGDGRFGRLRRPGDLPVRRPDADRLRGQRRGLRRHHHADRPRHPAHDASHHPAPDRSADRR